MLYCGWYGESQETEIGPGQGIQKTSLRKCPFSRDLKGKEEITKGRETG